MYNINMIVLVFLYTCIDIFNLLLKSRKQWKLSDSNKLTFHPFIDISSTINSNSRDLILLTNFKINSIELVLIRY